MVLTGHDQRGTIAQERSEKTRLSQITGWVMQPEQPPLRLGDKPDHAVTAIADIEIAFMRNTARERRPGDAVMAERRTAIAPRLDAMAARCQCFGERDKRGLGAAERPGLGRRAVEGDAVIRHDYMRHYSRSRRALR